MTTPVSSMALVFAGSFIGSFGAAFLKSGAHRITKDWRTFLNAHLIAGVSTFLLSSVFFVMGVKHGELTVLYPLVSLGNIWTLVWSKLFFNEPLNRMKFAGVGLILVGIGFLGLGNH